MSCYGCKKAHLTEKLRIQHLADILCHLPPAGGPSWGCCPVCPPAVWRHQPGGQQAAREHQPHRERHQRRHQNPSTQWQSSELRPYSSHLVSIRDTFGTLIFFFSWLPVTEDVDEAPFVYGFLADLIESNNQHILGSNNSNLPRVIAIIAEALAVEVLPPDNSAKLRMINLVNQVKVPSPLSLLLSRRTNICRAMRPCSRPVWRSCRREQYRRSSPVSRHTPRHPQSFESQS